MLLFVGSEERGFFCTDVAKKRNIECRYLPASLHISSQAADILKYKEEADAIIYDLEQYADEPEEIGKWILKIQDAIGKKTVIYAAGFSPQSKVIFELYQKGIRNFIFPVFLSEQKKDLELALDGYFENFGYEDRGIVFGEPEEVLEEAEKTAGLKRSIGIAGAVHRMGTTTQAVQMVKHIQYCGQKAAYVQMNGHKWVQNLAEAYSEADHDPEKGLVTYQKVDMLYRMDKLQEARKEYDFLVYDYGVYSEHDFNKISFLEKDIQIFVVGSKPGEFDKTYDVIENNFYNDVFYIFSFVADTEQKDLLELMEDKAEKTFFAKTACDPFAYSADSFYQKILPLEPELEEKTKRRFFKKKGGKKHG